MMELLGQLATYRPFDENEARMTARLRNFLGATQGDNPFGRDLAGVAPEWGHLTGSAWIVDPNFSQCVLLHHAKLNKWVQPGGHCDGQSDVLEVARREAGEETGLRVEALQPDIFDVDVHEIPEYWNTPAHLHFDVRSIFVADLNQKIVENHESRDVRWLSLEEAEKLSGEESIARMIRKTRRRSTLAL